MLQIVLQFVRRIMFELPPCRIFDHRNLPQIFKLRLKFTRDNVLNLKVVGERIELMEENLKDTTTTVTEERALEKETQPGEQAAAQPAAQAAAQQEAPAAQPVYQYAVNPEILPPVKNNENFITQPSKPKKTRGKAAKVIALALCCSLVGGAAGAGSVLCFEHLLRRPGMKIARMNGDGPDKSERRNNNQEWSARSDDDRDSFRNRGGNYGSQRKGTGRDSQSFGNDQNRNQDKNRDQDQGRGQQNGGRKDFGQNRQSQGAPNINGKDQGTNQQPDKGSDANNNKTTPPDNAQTKPSDGGEAKN